MRRGQVAVVCIAVTHFAACGGQVPQDSAAGGPDTGPVLDAAADLGSTLAGKGFFYWEDRVWHRDGIEGGIPLQLPLPESTFQPVTSTALYMASFSADATGLTLTAVRSGDPSYSGVLQQPGPAPSSTPQMDWNLQPSFAGASFSVWATGTALNAGLTILGSGLPVAAANRGELRPPARH